MPDLAIRTTRDPKAWITDHLFTLMKVEYREGEPDSYGMRDQYELRTPCPSWWAANVVSSEQGSGRHGVAIDIDHPALLVESSTAGHHHLYVDLPVPLTWRRYKRLLRALARAGVIERGYYRASKRRKATHLRRPGITKGSAAGTLPSTDY